LAAGALGSVGEHQRGCRLGVAVVPVALAGVYIAGEPGPRNGTLGLRPGAV
jgi:hypothetical protein